ncbi:MAG TPA: thiamine pyrophosphate-dependent enzyme [Terracidiphilus sp.]|nr:thiamine pyrophosphate-dependent enzyme [Terracidiphilus sp.]
MTIRIQSKAHPHAALPAEGSASLISDARLIEIYATMLKCRMLRERIRNLAGPAKERAFTAGSEAVAAAVLNGVQPDDSLILATPHICAALLKGVPLATLLRPFSSRLSAAYFDSELAKIHIDSGVLVAPFIGPASRSFTAGALAAGTAFAAAMKGNRKHVAVAFYGDAGAENSWREIFHFALAHSLAVVFVRQSARPLPSESRRGRPRKFAPGTLPIIPVDANDAVAVYRVAHEAIAHARRGSGPTLIDCIPLRLAGERKQDSDCIGRMERYLEAKGLRPGLIRPGVTAKFTRALDAAATAARRGARKHRKDRRSANPGK